VITLVRRIASNVAGIEVKLVNAVSPGLVDTPIHAGLPREVRDALFQGFAAAAPVQRVGQPEELAQAVLYLMTNPFATGSTLFVDGGYTLH
jgi:NAD(P)-dependent dehydrogenase (short-subunit alcohol dehydrogenase family)